MISKVINLKLRYGQGPADLRFPVPVAANTGSTIQDASARMCGARYERTTKQRAVPLESLCRRQKSPPFQARYPTHVIPWRAVVGPSLPSARCWAGLMISMLYVLYAGVFVTVR